MRYLKHITITFFAILGIAILIGLNIGASLHYSDHPLMYTLDNEGPYISYENDSTLHIQYIKGDKVEGFHINEYYQPITSDESIKCYYQIDSTSFDVRIATDIDSPPTIYADDQPIIAISDIEGSYQALRDFLIQHKVIDKELNWNFGAGHLVLLGDFVDRGWSETQVLWLIYRLDQDAQKYGGQVHFIIGNHELKRMQGNHGAAADKYLAVSNILGIVQSDLYRPNTVLGRWMSSKNAIELINGNLFVHGGLHPDIANTQASLDEINQVVKDHYYQPYYPKKGAGTEQLYTSNRTGICWYRGYFKDDLTQDQVEQSLNALNAKTVIVGHTLQPKVSKTYQGKVIGIDVAHPKDYQNYWPYRKSEGLLIAGDNYYRILADGNKIEI